MHFYNGKIANYCQKSKATKQTKSQKAQPGYQPVGSALAQSASAVDDRSSIVFMFNPTGTETPKQYVTY